MQSPRFHAAWGDIVSLSVWYLLVAYVVCIAVIEMFASRMTVWFVRERRLRAMKIVTVLLLLVMSIALFLAPTYADSREHLHAAYLISQGETPFTDFWEQHSPLWWYALAPLFWLINSPAVIPVIGVVMILLAIGTLVIVFRTTKEVCGDDEIAWLSVMLLALTKHWLGGFVVMKPDPLMGLFFITSLYFLVRYLRHGTHVSILWCGMFQGLAFMTAQKNFLFIPLFVAIVFFRKGVSWQGMLEAGIFIASAALPVLAIGGLLFMTGGLQALRDAYLLNIVQNKFISSSSPSWTFIVINISTGLLQLAVLALIGVFRYGGLLRRWLIVLVVMGITFFIGTILGLRYYGNDLQIIYAVLLAGVAAQGVVVLLRNAGPRGRVWLVLLIILPTVVWIPSFRPMSDIDEISYYVQHYNGQPTASSFVFNKDVSWDWFRTRAQPHSLKPMARDFLLSNGFTVFNMSDGEIADATNITLLVEVRDEQAFIDRGFRRCTDTILCR